MRGGYLGSNAEQEPLARAIEVGAAGVLHKSASISKVLEAVRRLRDGEHLLSPLRYSKRSGLPPKDAA